MSIKSINISPNLLPTPPLGYSYISTDENGNLCIKLDNGDVVYPSGVDRLSNLTDVSLSGVSYGQLLMWNGSKWVNSTVNIDLSSIESSISTEESTRIIQVSSLETSILNHSGITFDPSSLETSISVEESTRIVADSSLETRINNIPTGTTFDPSSLETSISTEESTRIIQISSLENSISIEESTRILTDSSLNTEISQEISTRIEVCDSLSTELSTHKHSSLYDPNGNEKVNVSNFRVSVTGELSVDSIITNPMAINTIGKTSLAELLVEQPEITLKNGSTNNKIGYDSENRLQTTDKGNTWTRLVMVGDPTIVHDRMFAYWNNVSSNLEFKNIEISEVNGLSSAISTEESTRILADSSLETRINNIPTGTTFDPSSLETSISVEESTRILADSSLATAISIIPTGSTFTGGTIDYLNITNNLKGGGFIDYKKENNLGYYTTLKLDLTGFPGGWSVNLDYFDNGLVVQNDGSSNLTLFYRDRNVCEYLGSGYFSSSNGIVFTLNNKIYKLTNNKIEWVSLVNGYVDITTYSGYTSGNTNFVCDTIFDVNYQQTNAYQPRHKKGNNCEYVRDTNGRLLKLYLSGATFKVDLISNNILSYSYYNSGGTDIVRLATTGLTFNTYTNGILTSSVNITNSNWFKSTHTADYTRIRFVEEDENYIVFIYDWTNLQFTIFDKNLQTYTYSSSSSIKGGNISNSQTSIIKNNNVVLWNDSSLQRFYINPLTKAVTYNAIFSTLTVESDMVYTNNAVYALSGFFSGYDSKTIKKYYLPTTEYTQSVDQINDLTLTNYIDLKYISDNVDTKISNITTTVNNLESKIAPYKIMEVAGNITSTGYCIFEEGYRLLTSNPSNLQDLSTGTNIATWTKKYSDIMIVDKRYIYIMETNSQTHIRNSNISGITCYNIYNNTFNFIETGITFIDILFNHRDKLIGYKDTTNSRLKIYDCRTQTIIKNISYSDNNELIIPVDKDTYCYKQSGNTFEIRNMSNDSVLKTTSYSSVLVKYGFMYNAYNNTIYGHDNDSVPNYLRAINILTGQKIDLGNPAYIQSYQTENFIFIGQSSNTSELHIYNLFNKYLGKVNQTSPGRSVTISNGKYLSFCDSSDGNKLKIIF
jgi:hypothetical protein